MTSLATPPARTPAGARSTNRPSAHLRTERRLLREGATVVAGMDEVGRGALAGPVTVGVVAVDLSTRSGPRGVTDSKLLTPAARTALLPELNRWGLARAVGHASSTEIDELGIMAALRLAGMRALADLGVEVDLVLLDGAHDWLSPPAQPDLFEATEPSEATEPFGAPVTAALHRAPCPPVRTQVKADRTCASVAAASVLAKCARDALMVTWHEDHPQYGWRENKGYGSTEHIEALREHGPSPLHRVSWRLPALGD